MAGSPLALAILADLPYPPRSGNHLRDLQTLELLDLLGYELAVVAADRGCWPGQRSIGPHGRLHDCIRVAPETTTVRGRARRIVRLAGAASGLRLVGPWALAYDDAGFRDHIVRAVSELRPEAVLLRSTLAHLAPELRPFVPLLVLDVHDADTLLARSLLSLRDPLRFLVGALRMAAARRVDRLTAIADEAWVPSAREADHLQPLAAGAQVLVIPSGVHMPERFPERPRRHRSQLLLLGGFGYPPNAAAATRLVEEVLPRVRDRYPNAKVLLVGRDLSPALVDRWRGLPVRWVGVIEELAAVFEEAAALVLPYDPATETGTPLKIADAIARGIPVVATPNATEPLGLLSEEHVLTGQTPPELANAVLRVLDDQDSATERARRAHAWGLINLDPRRTVHRLQRESVLARTIAA